MLLLLLQASACSLVGQQRPVARTSLPSAAISVPPVSNEELYARILQSPCDIVGLPIDFEADAEVRTVGNVRIDVGYPRWSIVDVGGAPPAVVPGEGAHLIGTHVMSTFLIPDPTVVEALTGGPGWHNESHDCQRLVMPGTRRPIIRFPSRLDRTPPLQREMPRREEMTRRVPQSDRYFGPLVGIFPLHDAMALEVIANTTLAVATIFNWGDRALEPLEYGRLGIGDGWSCLWLRAEEGVTRAAIASTTEPCAGAPAPADFPLEVRVSVWEPGNPLGQMAYPRSARWGWDEPRSRHYIGIKCGTAWCSIGVSTPPVEAVLSGPPHLAIPGWYDQQHLAVATGDILRPGPWTTIAPDSLYWMRMHDLNAANASATHATINADMADADGMVVAHIDIPDPASGVGQYDQKFNLSPNNPGNSTMRFVGSLPDQLVATFNMGTPAPRVTFVPGSMHSSPGAVRWRWQETDEKSWASCGGGCCTGGS